MDSTTELLSFLLSKISEVYSKKFSARNNPNLYNDYCSIIASYKIEIENLLKLSDSWKSMNAPLSSYYISKYGMVFSLVKYRVLKGCFDKEGYVYVTIKTDSGLMVSKKVHRLVAQVFIPNPENKPQVNHLDFNKSNNVVGNLAWATSQEDADHKVLNNRQATGGSFPKREGIKLNKKNLQHG